MFLGPGKKDRDNQSHYDKSGYDVFDHGSHSVVVGDRAAKDDTMGAAVNPQRWDPVRENGSHLEPEWDPLFHTRRPDYAAPTLGLPDPVGARARGPGSIGRPDRNCARSKVPITSRMARRRRA